MDVRVDYWDWHFDVFCRSFRPGGQLCASAMRGCGVKAKVSYGHRRWHAIGHKTKASVESLSVLKLVIGI